MTPGRPPGSFAGRRRRRCPPAGGNDPTTPHASWRGCAVTKPSGSPARPSPPTAAGPPADRADYPTAELGRASDGWPVAATPCDSCRPRRLRTTFAPMALVRYAGASTWHQPLLAPGIWPAEALRYPLRALSPWPAAALLAAALVALDRLRVQPGVVRTAPLGRSLAARRQGRPPDAEPALTAVRHPGGYRDAQRGPA